MKAMSFLLGILLIIGAYEMGQVSSLITRDFLDTLALPDSDNCDSLTTRLICSRVPYRMFDGTCNNLCNTSRGSIGTPLVRLETLDEPTAYETDDFEPRSSSSIQGKLLPNARRIANVVFESNSTANVNGTAPPFTHLVMTWGQFIDHDITLTELEEAECGTNEDEVCPVRPGCIGIDIPAGEELEVNETFGCIPLRRSFRDSYGNQINVITPYMDASQVYGSTQQLSNVLRGKKGYLDVRPFIDFGRDKVLPPDFETFCRSDNPEEEPCFLAGDVRSNENHALTTLHVVFVREHNRIARALHSLNPQWSDERVFQEARRIVGAEMQHITYNQWLPVFFDEALRNRTGLLLEGEGEFFDRYDPRENAQMINSFSTACLRFGHTLIRNEFDLLDSSFRRRGFPEPAIPVKDFYIPAPFFREGNNPFGGIVNGLMVFRARQFDHIFAPAIRNFLSFGDGPAALNGFFGDLAGMNIIRGRDHGLPGYVKFREACGAKPAKVFPDLLDTISQDRINRLKLVYSNVFDIDLFAGALNEFPTKESRLGFTVTCILTEGFRRLRFGDRFWYEREHELGFEMDQLTEIRKVTLGRVLCDNVDLVEFVPNTGVFDVPGTRVAVSCGSLPFMDLRVFKEGFRGSENGDGSQGGDGESNPSVGA